MRLENTTKIVICLAVTAFALCIADMATTYVAVSNGAQELNPVVAKDITSYGLSTALLLAMVVPIFASTFSVGGSMVINRTLNQEVGLSISERSNIKRCVTLGLSGIITVVIALRLFAVVNNLSELLRVGII